LVEQIDTNSNRIRKSTKGENIELKAESERENKFSQFFKKKSSEKQAHKLINIDSLLLSPMAIKEN